MHQNTLSIQRAFASYERAFALKRESDLLFNANVLPFDESALPFERARSSDRRAFASNDRVFTSDEMALSHLMLTLSHLVHTLSHLKNTLSKPRHPATTSQPPRGSFLETITAQRSFACFINDFYFQTKNSRKTPFFSASDEGPPALASPRNIFENGTLVVIFKISFQNRIVCCDTINREWLRQMHYTP